MKEITIVSGKGGTGKTSFTAALASLAKKAVFCDNDVDAADLHIIFKPEILETNHFSSGWEMSIDPGLCSSCGKCLELCRFSAILPGEKQYMVIDPYSCEGCRLCERVCPENAIKSVHNKKNQWFVSNTRFGWFVHAAMAPGEENSGKLVSRIKEKAKEIARENQIDYLINDGPPGIGCATISSLSGSDLAIIVTEPSKSGLHDAARLADLINSFNIEVRGVINKADINPGIAREINHYLQNRNIPVIAELPFSLKINEAMANMQNIIEYNPGLVISGAIKKAWEEIK